MEKDLVVSICAVVGAGLGVLNLVRTYLSDSERATVAVWSGGEAQYPNIEVVNRSPFPITVLRIGTVHSDGQVADAVLFAVSGVSGTSLALPKRIEARDSHEFRISMRETIAMQVHETRYTFVRTALGNVFTSESLLARWRRRALEILRLKSRVL